jgi:hypothetical protein
MRIIFTLTAILLLAVGVVNYIWLSPGADQSAQDLSLMEDSADLGQELVELLPNYDQREKEENAPITQAVDNNLYAIDADEILEKSGAALQVLVDDYDQALLDPEKKKRIEQQMEEVSKEHKKAILAKLNKGEL